MCPGLPGAHQALNGFDVDLAADQTRVANRLRDTLTGIFPAQERALGPGWAMPESGTCWPSTPTPSALRQAGRARILRTLKARSPRLAARSPTRFSRLWTPRRW